MVVDNYASNSNFHLIITVASSLEAGFHSEDEEFDSDEYDSDGDENYVHDYETEFAYWNMNNTYDDDFADSVTDY